MECPNCNKHYDDDFAYCPYCGIKKPEPLACHKCGFQSNEFSFCPNCGEKLITLIELKKLKILEENKNRIEELKDYSFSLNLHRHININDIITDINNNIITQKSDLDEIKDRISLINNVSIGHLDGGTLQIIKRDLYENKISDIDTLKLKINEMEEKQKNRYKLLKEIHITNFDEPICSFLENILRNSILNYDITNINQLETTKNRWIKSIEEFFDDMDIEEEEEWYYLTNEEKIDFLLENI